MNERVQTYHSDKLGRVTIPDSEEEMTPAEEVDQLAKLVEEQDSEIKTLKICLDEIKHIANSGFPFKDVFADWVKINSIIDSAIQDDLAIDQIEICHECGDSVAHGSGKAANRVSDNNTILERKRDMNKIHPVGGFHCAECEEWERREKLR